MEIMNIHFLQPLFLYGGFLIPLSIYAFIKYENKRNINNIFHEDIKKVFPINNPIFHIKIGLFIAIIICFLLLLADPHKQNIKQKIKKNGIDIGLIIDISNSMKAVDIKPNRIEKSKELLKDFIKTQKTNRVGLIVFAGKPLSSIPLTFDYNILTESIDNLSTDTLSKNVQGLSGTNIGEALLMGQNLFKTKKNKKKEEKKGKKEREKVIILLTDGDPSNGTLNPGIVSKLLAEEKIKIYPIGVGSKEGGIIEVYNGLFMQQVKIKPLNEKFLKEIAKNTNGHFFRATDNSSLEKIFKKLGELEKNDIEITINKNFNEYYSPFIHILIILIASFFFLQIGRVKT